MRRTKKNKLGIYLAIASGLVVTAGATLTYVSLVNKNQNLLNNRISIIKQKEQEIEVTKKILIKAQHTLNNTKIKQKDLIKNLDLTNQEMGELSSKDFSLNQTIKQFKNEISNLDIKLANTSLQLEKSKKLLDQTTQNRLNVASELEQIKKRIKQKENDIFLKQEAITKNELAKQESDKQLVIASEKLKNMNEQLIKAVNEHIAARETAAEFSRYIKFVLRPKHEKVHEQFAEKEKELEKVQKEYESLKQDLDHINERKSELEERLTWYIEDTNKRKSEYDKINNQLNEALKDKNKDVDEIKELVSEAQDYYHYFMSEKENKDNVEHQLSNQIPEQISDLNEKISSVAKKLEDTEKQVRIAYEAFRASFDEYNNKIGTKNINNQKKVAETYKELTKARENYNYALNNFQAANILVERRTQKFNQVKQEYIDLFKEKETLESNKAKLEEVLEIANKKEQIMNSKNLNKIDSEYKDLNKQKEMLIQKYQNAKNELASLFKQKESFKQQIIDIQASVENTDKAISFLAMDVLSKAKILEHKIKELEQIKNKLSVI
ncbi:hypothetical protein ACWXVO_02595 [Mycoplasma sp. 1890]